MIYCKIITEEKGVQNSQIIVKAIFWYFSVQIYFTYIRKWEEIIKLMTYMKVILFLWDTKAGRIKVEVLSRLVIVVLRTHKELTPGVAHSSSCCVVSRTISTWQTLLTAVFSTQFFLEKTLGFLNIPCFFFF